MNPLATPTSQSSPAVEGDPRSGKYLTLLLGQEEFGIRVQKVREITSMQQITVVPQTPSYVNGVLNLRGKVIPIIDLRLKFDLPRAEISELTCIIVVEVQHGSSILLMGVVVDSVAEVITTTEDDIEDLPQVEDGSAGHHFFGLAKTRNKITMLLNIEALLSPQELNTLDALAK